MPEIKHPLLVVEDEEFGQIFGITDKHSICDVLRHLVAESGLDTVKTLIDGMVEEAAQPNDTKETK